MSCSSVPGGSSKNASNHLLAILQIVQVLTSRTYSTLISPSLRLSCTLLLPALANHASRFLSAISPLRLKDWYRIPSSLFTLVVTLVTDTPPGRALQQQCATVASTIVDVATLHSSRQCLIDLSALLVRTGEALNTPEVHALLRHAAVVYCRAADVASTGKAKQLAHNVADGLIQIVQLASHATTVAGLAEITAFLCHALDMERVLHQPLRIRLRKKRARLTRARRRHDRNRHLRHTYTHKVLLHDSHHHLVDNSVEDAILSSLGTPSLTDHWMTALGADGAGSTGTPEAASLPSRVEVPHAATQRNEDPDDEWSIATEQTGNISPLPHSYPDAAEKVDNARFDEVKDTCDIAYLRKGIERRALNVAMLRNNPSPTALNSDLLSGAASTSKREQRVGDSTNSLHEHEERSIRDFGNNNARQYPNDADNLDVEDLKLTASTPTIEGSSRNANLALESDLETKGLMSENRVKPHSNQLRYEHSHNDVENKYSDYETTAVENHISHQGAEPVNNGTKNDYGEHRNVSNIIPAPRGSSYSSAVTQFYRTLDDITARKRGDAIRAILENGRQDDDESYRLGGGGGKDTFKQHKKRLPKRWYPKAAAAAGAGNENGQDIIQNAIASPRLQKKQSSTTDPARRTHNMLAIVGSWNWKRKLLLLGSLSFVLFLCLAWMAFAIYGCYIFFFSPTSASNEIIVRFVRDGSSSASPTTSTNNDILPPRKQDSGDDDDLEQRIIRAATAAVQMAIRND